MSHWMRRSGKFLPDPIFRAAEQLAHWMKKSRSRLYAEAIAKYVDNHALDDITERLNAVCGAEPSVVDVALQCDQAKTVSHEAW